VETYKYNPVWYHNRGLDQTSGKGGPLLSRTSNPLLTKKGGEGGKDIDWAILLWLGGRGKRTSAKKAWSKNWVREQKLERVKKAQRRTKFSRVIRSEAGGEGNDVAEIKEERV